MVVLGRERGGALDSRNGVRPDSRRGQIENPGRLDRAFSAPVKALDFILNYVGSHLRIFEEQRDATYLM